MAGQLGSPAAHVYKVRQGKPVYELCRTLHKIGHAHAGVRWHGNGIKPARTSLCQRIEHNLC